MRRLPLLQPLLLAAMLADLLPPPAAAAPPEDVWKLTLLANNDPSGACRAQADVLGQQVQDRFNAAVPGFTPYLPDTSVGRFLRTMERELQVRTCLKCSRQANWQWCLWNGCNCACGGRRQLVSDDASLMAQVLAAKRQVDDWLKHQSVQLGCDLGLVMERLRA